ncbi:MAG TPA: lmo0937 family membrane protein [Candidatus Paceibacterota bacterium]|nr:lmo0937 family membrane protein [Candidatus Paceibacterota bacterium]
MLLTIAVLLIILWGLGLVTSYTLGGFIHLLLLVAIVMVLIRIIQGKNPISGGG